MAFEMPSEEYQSYLDKQTGRVVMVQSEILSAVEERDEEVFRRSRGRRRQRNGNRQSNSQ